MKKLLLILCVFILPLSSIYSQCEISPYIQNNYGFDAKVLTLRDIISDPNDPDYNNPFIPESRFTPYLEKLSAIYNQAENEPLIDLLFNEYQIHSNVYSYNTDFIPYKRMNIYVDNDIDWLAEFIATGLSGDSSLDQLMTSFQFNIANSIEFNNITYIALESELDFVNITALVDDFEVIVGLVDIEPWAGPFGTGTYIGIPYEFEFGILATLCDIVVENDQFTFSVHGGDCPAGCIYNDYWEIYISNDCEVVLNTISFDKFEFNITPNPVSEILHITFPNDFKNEYSIKIFSIQGKQIQEFKNTAKSIDVSKLVSGLYFIKIQTENNLIVTKKFIKK